MVRQKAIIRNQNGMHLRVAGQVVDAARRFGVDVTICKGCEKADGCSILQLLMLGAAEGSEIEVIVEGKESCEALSSLMGIFSDGGGI